MGGKTAPDCFVLTNCTGRKLLRGPRLELAQRGTTRGAADLAKQWVSALNQAPRPTIAAEYYAGRSFQDARRAAHLLDANLLIASAGLGLVEADERVPAYDLTIGTGPSSILPRLKATHDTPADWWRELTLALHEASPLAALLAAHPAARVYIAMPTTYMAMISVELASLASSARQRLRIFTSSAWLETAPETLRDQVLPYDDRLETTSYSGTRTDFAQRALLHFIECIDGQSLPLSEARTRVQDAMKAQSWRRLPSRAKKSDDEIAMALRHHWNAHHGESGRLLRFLRDEAQIQCEQSRFRALWLQVKAEMAEDVEA